MRSLFDLDHNSEIIISPEAYTITVYKKIWDRDKSKDKSKAKMDLAYIFWFKDFRSYIGDITDEVQKHNEIVSLIDDTRKYEPDDLVKEAIEVYSKDIPLSLGFLTDVKKGINELRRYFRELNLTEVDMKTGKPVHNANQVMTSITKTKDLLDTLEKLELKVKKDLDVQGNARGNKEIGMYED